MWFYLILPSNIMLPGNLHANVVDWLCDCAWCVDPSLILLLGGADSEASYRKYSNCLLNSVSVQIHTNRIVIWCRTQFQQSLTLKHIADFYFSILYRHYIL